VNEREAGIADIAKAFLKIGAVSYGEPAIVGIMQTELQAFMRGVGPAVIGALVVSLTWMALAAAPDILTSALLVLTVAILLLRSVGPFPLILSGAVIGIIRRMFRWELFARLVA
jgi:chromate transport protein ChrA